MHPESPPDQQPPKPRRLTPGQIWTFIVVVAVPSIVGGGNLLGALPKYEDGATWLKRHLSKQDEKHDSEPGGSGIETASLDCVPETSAAAAYDILGDGSYSSKKQNFAVFAGNWICGTGWTGKVRSTPKFDNGTWSVTLEGARGDISLRSSRGDWAHVREGNRVRYRGQFAEFSEQEAIVVDSAELLEILKRPPQPAPTSQKKPFSLFGD